MNVPSYVCCTYRFPSTQRFSEVPVDSSGGLEGSIHIVTLVSQVPIMDSSFLCGSPGVAAFVIASIIAFSSGGPALAAFLPFSSAIAAEASSTIARARNPARPLRTLICIPPFSSWNQPAWTNDGRVYRIPRLVYHGPRGGNVHGQSGSTRIPRDGRGDTGGSRRGHERPRDERGGRKGPLPRGPEGQDRRRPDDLDRRRQVQGLDEEDRLGANQGAHPPRRARRDARVLRVLRGFPAAAREPVFLLRPDRIGLLRPAGRRQPLDDRPLPRRGRAGALGPGSRELLPAGTLLGRHARHRIRPEVSEARQGVRSLFDDGLDPLVHGVRREAARGAPG